MDKMHKERNEVEQRGSTVSYNVGFHSDMIGFISKKVSPYYKGKSCLVMGPSEGGEQEAELSNYFDHVTCVDGSSRVLEVLKKKCPEYTYVHALFEEAQFQNKFDTIIIMHVLEHVIDPVHVLQVAKNWLNKDGVFILTVPNAHSIHRMLGVEMGLLADVHEMNESDKRVGHRRIYDFESFERDIKKAGLQVVHKSGIFFKPFSNKQMESLTREQNEGFFKLGDKFPQHCAEICFICKQ
jgi:2-polyprenyl-3-methyl-5-hydroxy-6-metoxy-1,4-benzoquinol methylase